VAVTVKRVRLKAFLKTGMAITFSSCAELCAVNWAMSPVDLKTQDLLHNECGCFGGHSVPDDQRFNEEHNVSGFPKLDTDRHGGVARPYGAGTKKGLGRLRAIKAKLTVNVYDQLMIRRTITRIVTIKR
jgi:hypothetical protein